MGGWMLITALAACQDKGEDSAVTDEVTTVEDCADGVDNDGDGYVDCNDDDCDCTEDCADGVDNDHDGLVDCDDDDCSSTSTCYEDCDNDVDDDGDTLVDCDDPDCTNACPEDCGNGVDDDADGDIDCDDSECEITCIEDCDNGVDDDGDALVDCDDIDCTHLCDEDCDNDVDDDADGDIDCDDSECDCDEDCGNGEDDDGDGLVDCEDDDCVDVCIEDCDNGVDDDADGDADCDDDECFGVDGCGGPYDLSLTTSLTAARWTWGSGLVDDYGVYAVAQVYGQVTVEAVAQSWGTDTFTCTGSVDSSSGAGTGGLSYDYAGGSVDYAFAWEPSVANGGLVWDASCPIASLPLSYLGFIQSRPYVWRLESIWRPQYKGTSFSVSSGDDTTTNIIGSPTYDAPVEWSADY